MNCPPEVFARVLALYETGQCLEARDAGSSLGPLEDWPAVKPRSLASRLADHLGAPLLGQRLSLALFRAEPLAPEAQYNHILHVFERRGALAAWAERRRLGAPAHGGPSDVADYHGQCAHILGVLRDFDTAEWHLAQGRDAVPGRPYWYVERASLAMLEDRYEEALRSAREGLALAPQYPPIVLTTARAMQLLDRGDEALPLLRSAAADTQSSLILAHLASVLLRHRLFDEADAALDRYDALTPLKEDTTRNFIAVNRAETAIHRGDYRSAMEFVEQVQHPFYAQVAANLRAFLADASSTSPRHVELAVPFVRQHHMTCAPATLSAISRFWAHPAEHLEVAEEICYDGTPNHSERRWADDNGWVTAEFRVEWETAIDLLDRGIPFTLQISDVASGHLVAVVGYDRPRGLLLARDPTAPETVEINARGFLVQHRATGPRGMALVPREHARSLDGVKLPDSELYDLYHDLQLALQRHDREGALALQQRMIDAIPNHRLTLTARRSLAAYDDNPHEELAAVDGLLALYPDDPALHLSRLSSLRPLSARVERLAWLETVCARPDTDALLWVEYAAELMDDERMLPRARHFVRRALRRRPHDPGCIHRLARVTWKLGARDEAVELYRLAACGAATREAMAQDYFYACRFVNKTGTALEFLRSRVDRYGSQSGYPAMTLCWALETLDRLDEAFAVLEQAVARRAQDSELRVWVADRYALWGRPHEAAAHLAAAKGAKRTLWLAHSARAARLAGDRARALEAWRDVLAQRPLDLDAHRAVALVLSEMSDADAAARHLEAYCERFPHHAGLRHLLYEWTSDRPATDRERVLRQLLDIDPVNAWSIRELALNLCGQGRLDEALQLAEEALTLEGSAPGHGVRAYVLQRAGRRTEAAASYRAAIVRSADAADAIRGLLDTAGDTRERALEVLGFVESQLLEQPMIGDGVLAFSAAARGILTPAELFLPLERLHAQRPDLWQCWSALITHNTESGRVDEALRLATQASERFAHLPRVWLDLSRVHRARHDPEAEIAVLRRCRELNSEWADASIELMSALARAGRPDDAQHAIESAIRLLPTAPELRGHLALLLHQRGEIDKAIVVLQDALKINPEYPWAWEALADWSSAQGRANVALELATAFAEARPQESQPWVRLANLRLRLDRSVEALDAVERAIKISPLDVAAHDLRACVLTTLRRFHEAENACHPAELGTDVPLILRGRAAWVDAQRGDFSAAIKGMDALVEAHPDYAWGWSQLTDWNQSIDAIPPAIAAAERLAWLRPYGARAWQVIGDLKLRQGDRKGAADAFQRAMRLQPSEIYSGLQIVRLQMETKEFDGARLTLDILRPFAAPSEIRASEAQLAAARNDRVTYLTLVREMCQDPGASPMALTRAVEAAVRADWIRPLERTLSDLMTGDVWNPATATLWVRVRARRVRFGGPWTYRWLATLGKPGKDAIDELLSQIGAAARSQASARLVLTLHLVLIRLFCRSWRSDVRFWGQFGYALTCLGQSRWAVRWLGDWRSRSAVEPWMLQNLASSLLTLRRARSAQAVLRAVAQELAPRMEIGVILSLWAIIGACLDDDVPLAERLLYQTPRDTVSDARRALWELSATLVEVCRDPATRESLTPERLRRLVWTSDELRRLPDTGYLARLACLKAARHARSPWRTIRAWTALHPALVTVGSVIMLYLVLWLLGELIG